MPPEKIHGSKFARIQVLESECFRDNCIQYPPDHLDTPGKTMTGWESRNTGTRLEDNLIRCIREGDTFWKGVIVAIERCNCIAIERCYCSNRLFMPCCLKFFREWLRKRNIYLLVHFCFPFHACFHVYICVKLCFLPTVNLNDLSYVNLLFNLGFSFHVHFLISLCVKPYVRHFDHDHVFASVPVHLFFPFLGLRFSFY